MAYIVPQALVYQEFTRVPTEITDPLRACIVGGNAQLIRYSEADEKDDGALGEYDSTIDEDYLWPNRSAGAKVDTDYVKLFIDDALLHYYDKNIGTGGTVVPVSGKTNRIRASVVGFKTNTSSYPRSAAFYDRDVAIGDVVRVRGVVDSESIELWTYVHGFAYETVAAVISAAESASTNLDTQASDYTVTQIAGDENCVTLDADLTSYDGLADGGVNDTYTFEVIDGSVEGDYTVAVLRVTTASGNDDVAEFSPGADGVAKAVGSRGLEVTFASTGMGSSCSADVGEEVANELLPGQKWTIDVEGDFTAPTATAAGAYTGTIDTTYIVEVTRGGRYDASDSEDFPQITVATAHGTDITAPKLILADSTNYAVGTKGVQISFSATDGLRKGDKYLIPVTAAKTGRTSTLILGNDLGELVDATDLDLDLYIKTNIQVDQYRDGDIDTPNWETSATEITVKSGITTTHSEWTDDGVELTLDVISGDMYVEYRAWLPAAATSVSSITDGDGVDAIPGPLHPDNPMKYGVYCAWLNANGTSVKYIGVADPEDTDSWVTAIDKLAGRIDLYNIVPMSHDATVLNYVTGYVNSQSSPTAGRWRGAVYGLEGMATLGLVTEETSTDSEAVLATLADDPDTSGTQYTLLSVPEGNGQFIVNDVQPGDIVRYLYTSDGLGNEAYTEFEIDEVLSEDSVRLVTGHSVAITTAQKIEIWRNRTAQQEAEAIAAKAGSYGNRRVLTIWPDYGMSGDVQVDSMFVAAMVAGLRSGVAPHQGLTNVALVGLDSVARTTDKFNADQLNTMAAAGVWIISQDPQTGKIYNRHAVTTAGTASLNDQEEMIRVNVDSISYLFLNRLKSFIGVTNVTPTAIEAISTEISSVIRYLKSNGKSPNLGPQLISADLVRLEQSPIAADRVIAVLDIVVPAPLNNLELYLVI